MTLNVTNALESIKSLSLFNDSSFYFIGGTALAYYLQHRISEDIDIISKQTLPYKNIIATIQSIGGRKLRDENALALRLAGLFPDEYMLKFDLHGVKLEFFKASTLMQNSIVSDATITKYCDSKLNILDVKSIAKLKLLALLSRNKSRDIFDFKTILENKILNDSEILEITSQSNKEIKSLKHFYDFISNIEQPKDDEAVYLDEDKPINLTFEEIKENTLSVMKSWS
jgi:hypothetical protein